MGTDRDCVSLSPLRGDKTGERAGRKEGPLISGIRRDGVVLTIHANTRVDDCHVYSRLPFQREIAAIKRNLQMKMSMDGA